jgi:hypothetical protein
LKKLLPLLVIIAATASFTNDTKISADDVKINQVQIIATHNSYHLTTDKAILRFLKSLYKTHLLPRGLNPDEIDYTKDPLSVQLGSTTCAGLNWTFGPTPRAEGSINVKAWLMFGSPPHRILKRLKNRALK